MKFLRSQRNEVKQKFDLIRSELRAYRSEKNIVIIQTILGANVL